MSDEIETTDTTNPETKVSGFSFKVISPRGEGLKRETFAKYEKRVGPLLPNFPSEVLQDWIYHHHTDAVMNYSWLGFERLRFERQIWVTKRIVDEVQARQPEPIPIWRSQLLTKANFQQSKLGTFMIASGTWPTPPLVLDNRSLKVKHPRGETIHALHLIEGHHRLGYLHALCDNDGWVVRPQHEVWVVKRV